MSWEESMRQYISILDIKCVVIKEKNINGLKMTGEGQWRWIPRKFRNAIFFLKKKKSFIKSRFFLSLFFLFSLLFLESYHKSFFFVRVAHKLFLKPSSLLSRLETSFHHRGQQNTVKPHGTKVSKCSWNSPMKGYRSAGTLMTISELNGISWFLSPIKYKSKLVS